jgi:hypothetical protein
VSATDRVSEISTAAFIGVPSSDGSEQAIEIWGFEAAEGFSPGFIAGQAGWTAFSSSLVEGHIDTVNPNGGSQHLRISQDPAVAAGTLLGAFSPVATDLVVDASTMTVFVNIGAVGGASYDVVPQAPSQSFLTARVSFAFSGDILVLDDPGTGLTFVDTGVDYTPGTYVALQIDVDPGANTIDYFYNGVLIYSSAGGVFAGTLIEQVVLLSDNFNAGESADFDDLFIDRGAVPVELQSFDIE